MVAPLGFLLGMVCFLMGFYLHARIMNLLVSKLIVGAMLLAMGFFLRNPYLVVFLTILMLFSRHMYTPVQSDLVSDLKRYLFNRTMLRSKTYLMLVSTGGIFLGLALPAVVNYPLTIVLTTLFVVMLIWVVEFSNYKSFEEKIKKAAEKGGDLNDPIEALRYAYMLMNPFSNTDVEEVIKNRIELFKNVQDRKAAR